MKRDIKGDKGHPFWKLIFLSLKNVNENQINSETKILMKQAKKELAQKYFTICRTDSVPRSVF